MLYPTNHSSSPEGTEGYPSNKGFNKSSPELFYLFIRAGGIQAWVWLAGDVLPLGISPGTTCRAGDHDGCWAEIKQHFRTQLQVSFHTTNDPKKFWGFLGAPLQRSLGSQLQLAWPSDTFSASLKPPGAFLLCYLQETFLSPCLVHLLLSLSKILMYWQNWIYSHPKCKYGSI